MKRSILPALTPLMTWAIPEREYRLRRSRKSQRSPEEVDQLKAEANRKRERKAEKRKNNYVNCIANNKCLSIEDKNKLLGVGYSLGSFLDDVSRETGVNVSIG